MALNVAALDEELKALERKTQLIQDIKRLAANPDALPLLEQMLGNGVTATPSAPLSPVPQKVMFGEYSSLKQIDAVRRAIAKRVGVSFTTGDIGDELRGAGVDVNNIAIGRVLFRLQTRNEVSVSESGGGNIGNRYVATEKLRGA